MGRVTVIPDCERAQGEIRLLTWSLLPRVLCSPSERSRLTYNIARQAYFIACTYAI